MLLHELKPGDLIQTVTHGCSFPPETLFEVVEGYNGQIISEGYLYVLVWCPRQDAAGKPSPWNGDIHVHGYTKQDRTKTLQHGQCWARIDQNTILVPGRW